MADLGFAHDAGMQDGGKENDYINFIHKYMATFAVRTTLSKMFTHPNLFSIQTIGALRPLHQLLLYLPESADLKAHRLRGQTLLSNRLKLGKTRKDLFTHVLDADTDASPDKASMFTLAELYSNSNMMVIAGTDTTSSTMTQLLRALALNPKILKKMQQEIDEHCASRKEVSIESTKSLVYTSAVINESLRLFNPLPSGIYAATPPSGLTFPIFGDSEKESFIPGNVQVIIPHLALMTDERSFPRGKESIPERWTGEWSEGVRDRRAYIPFGYGVHSCVGKQLALNEMRFAFASVVREWDFVLGERYDEGQWRDGIRDHHTVKVGELWGRCVKRR